MSKKHYQVLGIAEDADKTEIKKAYHVLVKKYHPDKNGAKEAVEHLQEVMEAYDVLKDPKKKLMYDTFGESGLKCNFDPKQFVSTKISKLFESVFCPNPHGNKKNNDDMSVQKNNYRSDSVFGLFSDECSEFRKTKGASIEKVLKLSLSELFTGVVKSFKIHKKVFDRDGTFVKRSNIVQVNVKPGLKEGQTIVLHEEADIRHGQIPGDIVMIVKQKRNTFFERDGDNILYTHKISLGNALCFHRLDFKGRDPTMTVPTVLGDEMEVTIRGVVNPNTTICVVGEGMPIADCPEKKGNFIVMFNIVFPKDFSDVHAGLLMDVFGL